MCFLSPLISHSLSLTSPLLYSVLFRILSPTPFCLALSFPPSFFKAWLNPDRLARDKTLSFGDVRDICEQDGERDGGQISAGSPAAGPVETIEARRWVFHFVGFLLSYCSIIHWAAPESQVSK